MIESVKEISVSHDTTKNTLIIAKQHECHLTSNCNHGPELKALSIPVEIRGSDHGGGEELDKQRQTCEEVEETMGSKVKAHDVQNLDLLAVI